MRMYDPSPKVETACSGPCCFGQGGAPSHRCWTPDSVLDGCGNVATLADTWPIRGGQTSHAWSSWSIASSRDASAPRSSYDLTFSAPYSKSVGRTASEPWTHVERCETGCSAGGVVPRLLVDGKGIYILHSTDNVLRLFFHIKRANGNTIQDVHHDSLNIKQRRHMYICWIGRCFYICFWRVTIKYMLYGPTHQSTCYMVPPTSSTAI